MRKIFSSNSTFSEICNKLPKRADQQASKYTMAKENNNFLEKENSERNFNSKNYTFKQSNLNTPNTLRSLSNNSLKEKQQTKIQKPFRPQPPLDYKSYKLIFNHFIFFLKAKEFIKKELISLKELMIELKQKMENHTHDEYGNLII